MRPLDAILEKYGFVKRTKANYDYKFIEERIGFPLPDDYKYYLENYEHFDAPFGKEYIVLWRYDELLECNLGYLILEYLPNMFAIGGNGGGDFIGIEYRDGNYRIILCPFIGLDHFLEIGNSFTDLLERLDSGHEWFS